MLKLWAGGAIEIGSAAIPAGGTAKLGGQIGKEVLKSAIGRKIGQEIGVGVASGLLSGTVYGVGDALVNDKEILPTVVSDSAEFAASGGLLGSVGAYVQKFLRGKNLK